MVLTQVEGTSNTMTSYVELPAAEERLWFESQVWLPPYWLGNNDPDHGNVTRLFFFQM